ncbi:hypothetical protein ABZ807_14630 [Micromonospora sp. NPDC047548]|uniref:hypothetical protein n=1 Tax=Micromonospora sp. NPDC047548 TaxID=3155624 RepID=UPI003407F833
MRFGGRKSARVRRGLLAAGVVTVLAVTVVTVAVPLLRDRSQQRLERRADREATAIAQRARAELLADPAAGEAALRGAADRVDGVEVLAVEGGGQGREAGVRLVFRVRVAKTAASVFGWQQATTTRCFAQVVRPDAGPAALERVPCPA